MSQPGKIVYSVRVDTRKFEKQMRRLFIPRIRFALFLVSIAEKIGKMKLDYSIEQEKN